SKNPDCEDLLTAERGRSEERIDAPRVQSPEGSRHGVMQGSHGSIGDVQGGFADGPQVGGAGVSALEARSRVCLSGFGEVRSGLSPTRLHVGLVLVGYGLFMHAGATGTHGPVARSRRMKSLLTSLAPQGSGRLAYPPRAASNSAGSFGGRRRS